MYRRSEMQRVVLIVGLAVAALVVGRVVAGGVAGWSPPSTTPGGRRDRDLKSGARSVRSPAGTMRSTVLALQTRIGAPTSPPATASSSRCFGSLWTAAKVMAGQQFSFWQFELEGATD